MIESIICLFLVVIARVVAGQFNIFSSFVPYLDIAVIIMAVVVAIFIVIAIIKRIRS